MNFSENVRVMSSKIRRRNLFFASLMGGGGVVGYGYSLSLIQWLAALFNQIFHSLSLAAWFRVDRQKLWERKPSEWHSHRKGVGVGSCVCERKRVVESCGGILKDDNVLIGSWCSLCLGWCIEEGWKQKARQRSSHLFGGKKFIQFIATLAVLTRSIWKKRLISTDSSK